MSVAPPETRRPGGLTSFAPGHPSFFLLQVDERCRTGRRSLRGLVPTTKSCPGRQTQQPRPAMGGSTDFTGTIRRELKASLSALIGLEDAPKGDASQYGCSPGSFERSCGMRWRTVIPRLRFPTAKPPSFRSHTHVFLRRRSFASRIRCSTLDFFSRTQPP